MSYQAVLKQPARFLNLTCEPIKQPACHAER